MATHAGKEGIVKVGVNTILQVKDWSIEQTGDVVEDTAMGDQARTFLPTLESWSGSLSVHWDEEDVNGQGALQINSVVQLEVYPEGDQLGDIYFTGSAIITGITRDAAFDGAVNAAYTFQGSGALTQQTA